MSRKNVVIIGAAGWLVALLASELKTVGVNVLTEDDLGKDMQDKGDTLARLNVQECPDDMEMDIANAEVGLFDDEVEAIYKLKSSVRSMRFLHDDVDEFIRNPKDLMADDDPAPFYRQHSKHHSHQAKVQSKRLKQRGNPKGFNGFNKPCVR